MKFYQTHKWLMPPLLFTTLLIAARCLLTAEPLFAFLIWNIFLAILPLYFSYRLRRTRKKTAEYLWFCLWLLFFPNAAYIVTDLFHLRERLPVPLWFDLILLSSAAIYGVILGLISLYRVEQWLLRRLPGRYVQFAVFALLLLCGYGIYLGRYLRWNSWDIITSPWGLARSIMTTVVHPFQHRQSWLLSLVFGIWLMLMYNMLRHLTKSKPATIPELQEDENQAKKR